MSDLPRTSYLIVAPDRPSAEEYARGASLIPSMLDEGFKVWRVPALPDDVDDGDYIAERVAARDDVPPSPYE